MIKQIIFQINQKKNVKKLHSEFSQYLKPGSYKFDNSLTYIYLNDKNTIEKAARVFKNLYTVLNVNRGLFRRGFYNLLLNILNINLNIKSENSSSLFEGTVFLASSNQNSIKIFDFEKKEVLTIYKNKDEYNNYINNIDYFSTWFSIPEVIYKEEVKGLIIEKYIESKNMDLWRKQDYENLMQDIFKRYTLYTRNAKQEDFFIGSDCVKELNIENDFLAHIIDNTSTEVLEMKFPKFKLHGDLWSSNVLMVNEHVYYIDWDNAKEFIFFYDVFFIMWNEFIKRENYDLINSYIKGEYDSLFNELFNICGVVYERDKKIDYLNLFFINQFIDRWYMVDEKIVDKAFDRYRKFMKCINKKRSCKTEVD